MAGFGRPQREANMADQRTSCHPAFQLTVIFLRKPLRPY